jgi:hypothetical protein
MDILRNSSLSSWAGFVAMALIYGVLYALNLVLPLESSPIFHYNNYTTRIWSWSEFALAGTALFVLLRRRQVSVRSFLLGTGLSLLSGLSIYWRTQGAIDAVQEGVVVWLTFLAAASLFEANGAWRIAAFQGGVKPVLRSLLFGLLAAVPLAILNNLFFYITKGSAPFRDITRSAVLALSPGISEEIIFRYFIIALCAQWFPRGAKPAWKLVAAVALAVVPHSLNHLPDLFLGNPSMAVFMLAATSLLFGLPMALLQVKKNLETAISFHGLIDFVRFWFGY